MQSRYFVQSIAAALDLGAASTGAVYGRTSNAAAAREACRPWGGSSLVLTEAAGL